MYVYVCVQRVYRRSPAIGSSNNNGGGSIVEGQAPPTATTAADGRSNLDTPSVSTPFPLSAPTPFLGRSELQLSSQALIQRGKSGQLYKLLTGWQTADGWVGGTYPNKTGHQPLPAMPSKCAPLHTARGDTWTPYTRFGDAWHALLTTLPVATRGRPIKLPPTSLGMPSSPYCPWRHVSTRPPHLHFPWQHVPPPPLLPRGRYPPSKFGTWAHDCGDAGCLYDVAADPTEHVNLALTMPTIAAAMRSRLDTLNKDLYAPDRGVGDKAACAVAEDKYGGFYGPFVGV